MQFRPKNENELFLRDFHSFPAIDGIVNMIKNPCSELSHGQNVLRNFLIQ